MTSAKRMAAGLLGGAMGLALWITPVMAEEMPLQPEVLPVAEVVVETEEEPIAIESPEKAPEATPAEETPPAQQETTDPTLEESEESTAPAGTPIPDETQPEVTETPGEESEPPVDAGFTFAIFWDVAENEPLYAGDGVTLAAESEAGFEGMQLSWQVARKAAEDLLEEEAEWEALESGNGKAYGFVVQEEMRDWRWRLCIVTDEGETLYSEEVALPEISMRDAGEMPEATPQPEISVEAPVLPSAEISFHSMTPTEAITLGTEILLTAQVYDGCEGMRLQWQYMAQEDEGWQDVEGAEEAQYTVVLDEVNCAYAWRLLITVPGTVSVEQTDVPEGLAEETEDGEGVLAEESPAEAELE